MVDVCLNWLIAKEDSVSPPHPPPHTPHHANQYTVHREEAESRFLSGLDLLNADVSKGKEAEDVRFAPAGAPAPAASAADGAEMKQAAAVVAAPTAAAAAAAMGPPSFTYLPTVVDGDHPSCRVRQGPRQLAVCCSCKGGCVDPETCECLRQVGRLTLAWVGSACPGMK